MPLSLYFILVEIRSFVLNGKGPKGFEASISSVVMLQIQEEPDIERKL
jgi:hypothetical protein